MPFFLIVLNLGLGERLTGETPRPGRGLVGGVGDRDGLEARDVSVEQSTLRFGTKRWNDTDSVMSLLLDEAVS